MPDRIDHIGTTQSAFADQDNIRISINDRGKLPKLATPYPPNYVDIIKQFMQETSLTDHEIDVLLRQSQVVDKFMAVIGLLSGRDSGAYDHTITVRRETDGQVFIDISIKSKIAFNDSYKDMKESPSFMERETYSLNMTVTPLPKVAKKRGAKKIKHNESGGDPAEVEQELSALPLKNDNYGRICSPNDRACWQRQIEKFNGGQTMAKCGKYIDEQVEFEQKTAKLLDPIAPALMTDGVLRPERRETVTEIGQIFIKPTIEGIPQPSVKCMNEWNDTFNVVPTLACTEEYVKFEKANNVPLLDAASLPFSPLASIPGINNYLAYKSKQIVNGESYKTIWAMKWMDRVREGLEKKDYDYVDTALNSVAGNYKEMELIRGFLRRWYANEASGYHKEALFIYKEYFLEIYPEKADANGMPNFKEFPVKLWWATNWLANIKRRHLKIQDAFEMLKCTNYAEEAIVTLKELLPYLKATSRYGSRATELETLLENPKL